MDRTQFIQLIEQEQKPLRRFLCALCGGEGFRADDIAQEALLKAYMSFEKFEGRAKFSSWLFRIAYNCFYDNLKRAARDSLSPLDEARELAEDNAFEDKIANENLCLAIAKLSETEKAAVLLFYMEDKSLNDIVEILGIPSGTVRSHLSRARKHLRNFLKDIYYE